jgi:isocitrate dehydrogenase kinase/phosphatase
MLTVTSSTLFNFSMLKYIKLNIIPYYTALKNSAISFFNAVFNIILEFRNLFTNNLYILITNKPLKPRFTN